MGILRKIFIVLLVMACSQGMLGQNKKQKLNKKTSRREVEQKQEEAEQKEEETNQFNKLMPMGARQNDARDDLLWHAETANTVYESAGNLSLTSPSRYGLRQGLEISSTIPLNFWVPNVTIKKRWANNDWYIASKHGLYSATPGLKWARRQNYGSVVDSSASVPFVLAIKNELILSKYLSQSNTCSREQPYVILSAGLGIDYGFSFGDSALNEINEHFLTNRSPALTGNGLVLYVKVRADWQINRYLMLGGGLKYFYGDFTGHHAVEQATELQFFFLPDFSVSGGYVLSIAGYNTSSSLGFIPMFDLSWYFGKRQGRQKGLWGKSMRR